MSFKPVHFWSGSEQFADEIVTHAQGQKFVEHNPLIMPTHHTSSAIEHLVWFRSAFPDPIQDLIMKMQEREVKLRDEQVRVVSSIAYSLRGKSLIALSPVPIKNLSGSCTSYR